MKKSTLIGISILSVFVLCSLSYQSIIAEKFVNISVDNYTLNVLKDKSDIVEYDLNNSLIGVGFIFGTIYNLSYFEGEVEPDIIEKIYTFNCKNVILIYWNTYGESEIQKFDNDESHFILNCTMWGMEYSYIGHVGENFVCVLQVVKAYY